MLNFNRSGGLCGFDFEGLGMFLIPVLGYYSSCTFIVLNQNLANNIIGNKAKAVLTE